MVEGTDELVADFLVESYENLDALDQDLIALEQDPGDGETIARIFRTLHTVKGNAGALGFPALEKVAHAGESLLSKLRDRSVELDDRRTGALLATVDAVREMLAAIETTGADDTDHGYDELIARLQDAGAPGPAPGGPLPAVAAIPADPSPVPAPDTPPGTTQSPGPSDPAGEATTEPPKRKDSRPLGAILLEAGKVTAEQLDIALAEQALGDGRRLGEILVDHGVVTAEAVEEATRRQGNETRPALAESTIRVDTAVLDRLMNFVGELVLARNSIVEQLGPHAPSALAAAAQHLDHVTGDLQDAVMRARMQPIGSVWSKFPRLVRGLALTCNKQVRLLAEGEGTEVDRTIIEAIKDPLTHIVRNAIDHGIEPPAERIAAGKPAEGTLSLRAHHEGGQVVVEITDDGAGIDAEALKRKAVANGLISSTEATQMTAREAIPLIFAPGLSTARAVTNVSGRGVGMDVVLSSIEAIGGTVEVTTEVGRGTTLRIQIPLTLAIVPALIVACSGERFAVPLRNVIELIGIDTCQSAGAVEMYHDIPVFRRHGRLLPVVTLAEVLAVHAAALRRPPTMIVVSAGEWRFGLVVDEVVTTEEIVVKPLGAVLHHVHHFSGATIMGDGRVALILDVAGIARDSGAVAATTARQVNSRQDAAGAPEEATEMVLVAAAGGERRIAVPLRAVSRLEEIDPGKIESVQGADVLRYGEQIMPLVWIADPVGGGGRSGGGKHATVIVHEHHGEHVGFVVERVVDVVEATTRAVERGVLVVGEKVVELLDLCAAAERAHDHSPVPTGGR